MKLRRKQGKRTVGKIPAKCGTPEPVNAGHYLTKAECHLFTRKPLRNRCPHKPLFGAFQRHALYAVADARWLTPIFLIPSGFKTHPMTDTHSIQLVQVATKLFRHEELAKEMGVGSKFVLAMKRAGYRFTHAHQTTLESALAWRSAFPDFRQGPYLAPKWQKLPKLLSRSEPCGTERNP